jgi:hypothetical protein
MYEINNLPVYKTLILRTKDATADTDRHFFTFSKLRPFYINTDNATLKVKSVIVYGSGEDDAVSHAWTIKLGNVSYNNSYYINSDNEGLPTIAIFNYDTNKTGINSDDPILHLEKQNINNIVLYFSSHDGHGLTKNSKDIDVDITLTICEHQE